jgi:hypothetical protein
MTIENLIIYTYSDAVETAKELQDDLDCRRIAHSAARGVRRIPDGSLVVNWGYGRVPDWAAGKPVRYLNNPTAVRRKMSKVVQLQKFTKAGVPTFEFTTSADEAARWSRGGSRVLGRSEESYGGRGIVVYDGGALRDNRHEFYTRWFDKTHEFRFHVFRGEVIDVVQKKRLNDAKPLNELDLTGQTVRNFANGWIEAHKNLHLPGDSREQIAAVACRAVAAVGLDFGAVDVVVRFTGVGQRTLDAMAVCEVNTAPGCGEIERAAYTKAILKVYNAGV